MSSFRVAFSGIRYCVRYERNMRIHLAIALGVLLLSGFYPFGRTQYALLILLLGVVIAAEMMNTAVERAVDLESPSYNRLAKIAKDIAAGAVLVCAVAAVFVGLLLFGDRAGVEALLRFAGTHPFLFLAGAGAYAGAAVCFIFLPDVHR